MLLWRSIDNTYGENVHTTYPMFCSIQTAGLSITQICTHCSTRTVRIRHLFPTIRTYTTAAGERIGRSKEATDKPEEREEVLAALSSQGLEGIECCTTSFPYVLSMLRHSGNDNPHWRRMHFEKVHLCNERFSVHSLPPSIFLDAESIKSTAHADVPRLTHNCSLPNREGPQINASVRCQNKTSLHKGHFATLCVLRFRPRARKTG